MATPYPALTGRVIDQGRLLDTEAEQAVTARLASLEAETGARLVVLTLDNLQGRQIEVYGERLFRHWSLAPDSVLLIVAPRERKVRIEVGDNLDPVLTDALSSNIIQADILPPFRVTGYRRGITAGVDALSAQLRLPPAKARSQADAVMAERPELPFGPMMLVTLVFAFVLMGTVRASPIAGRHRRGRTGPILIWTAVPGRRRIGRDDPFAGGGVSGGW